MGEILNLLVVIKSLSDFNVSNSIFQVIKYIFILKFTFLFHIIFMYHLKKLLLFFVVLVPFFANAQNEKLQKALELADNGKYKKAIAIADKLIVENPYFASAYCLKASSQINLKQFNESLQTLRIGIQVMPDSLNLYTTRAMIYENYRLFKQAIQDLTTGYTKAKVDSNKVSFLISRGAVKFKIRDYQGSYNDQLKALEMDSTNIYIYNNIAMSCDELGKPEETIKYLNKVLEIDSVFIPAIVNLGFKYQRMEDHEKALEYLDKAVELDPEEGFAYSNRSFSRLKTGDVKGAMKDIEMAIKLKPSNSWAYKTRALIKIEMGKTSQACEDLSLANKWGFTNQYGDEVNEMIQQYCK